MIQAYDLSNDLQHPIKVNIQEVKQMASLKEEAKGYEPKHTLNIADLDVVSVDVEIQSENDVEFPYKYVEIDGQRYRVPASVIASLSALLEDNPNLTKVKVKKSGEGMKTNYTVIPLV